VTGDSSDVTTMPAIGELFAQPGETLEEPIDVVLHGVPDRLSAERDFSPVTHVSASAPPFLLVHGEDDGLVPFGQSEQLRDALREAGAPVTFHAVPGADHVWIGAELEPLVAEGIDFLDSVFR
jgi:dipeptidyl aminopeptidase/acylaminoacyl peptidase